MKQVLCPNCQHSIDIDQVVAHQIEESLNAKFQQEKATLQKKLADVELNLKRELWPKAQAEALKQAQAASDKVQQDLRQQLQEQEKRAKAAETAELEMRKKQRELEQEKAQFQIKLERELDTRLKEEQEKVTKLETERFLNKEREYQKQIEDMKALVEEARRKATTVSQQLQGEALELELEKLLREAFPSDTFEEVKKGQFGADVLQTVRNMQGKHVGIIVWEFKQTERFSDKWLAKLREDTRACHGSFAVLVTRTLPDDIKTCAERERVWITSMEFILPLTELLRQTLIKVEQEKLTQSGKDLKTEMLYSYINSQEFRGRVEGIVESFREMKDDLEREQRALQNSWKKREKQILRLATNTAYMYGEMQGLVGNSLPSIQGLELDDRSDEKPQIQSELF